MHTALDLQKLIAELALAEKKLAREEMLNEKKSAPCRLFRKPKRPATVFAIEIKCSKERLKLSGLSDSEIKAVSPVATASCSKADSK